MPRQVYRCPDHGEFEVGVPINDDVPEMKLCPILKLSKGRYEFSCSRASPWVPSAPNFIGGPTTGAKKE